MFVHFEFADGSNPYIATSNKELFRMINKYYVEQTDTTSFKVDGELSVLSCKKLSDYQRKQAVLRDFAIQWQFDFCNFCYYMSELAEWESFFREYGRKYGLLREFVENAIC